MNEYMYIYNIECIYVYIRWCEVHGIWSGIYKNPTRPAHHGFSSPPCIGPLKQNVGSLSSCGVWGPYQRSPVPIEPFQEGRVRDSSDVSCPLQLPGAAASISKTENRELPDAWTSKASLMIYFKDNRTYVLENIYWK